MERYLSFTQYCKDRFGRKLYRVALDAHMTCPNRDGTCGERGCIFCSSSGSGDFAISYTGQQLRKEDLIYNHQNAQPGDYIAYFQAYTNTYAPIEKLRVLYTSALKNELFAGISIATRADCISDEVIALLKEMKETYPEKFIWVELGLQSIHEESIIWMRRGYPQSVFDEAVEKLHEVDIDVIVHLIIGLPHETEKMILQSVEHLNTLQVEGVKLQLLHYLKDSDLGKLYEEDPEGFHVLSKEEYVEIITKCIAHLDEKIVIHRLSGDGNQEELLAPLWSLDKKNVLNTIRHELKEKNIIQGCMKGELL